MLQPTLPVQTDFVLDALKKNGEDIEAEIARLGAITDSEGNTVYATREDCIEEIVANSMFEVFTNEKFSQKMLDENRSLFGKIAKKVKTILADIKSAISMLGNSDAAIRALKDDAEALDKINSMFSILMFFAFSVSSFAYYDSYDLYGDPDKSWFESDEGSYEDGYEDGAGQIIFKTREVTAKEYIADHQTRFRELYITVLLALGICVVPILTFRYFIYKDCFEAGTATVITVVYNVFASVLITYIMYRIDYLVPCLSVVVLSGILCKKFLSD